MSQLMPPPPTESPLLPTRLLVAEIVPLTPVVPFPHVTAPFATAPERAVHYVIAVTEGTDAVRTHLIVLELPTKLLAAETVPVIPVVPPPHVTAPSYVFQVGLSTT